MRVPALALAGVTILLVVAPALGQSAAPTPGAVVESRPVVLSPRRRRSSGSRQSGPTFLWLNSVSLLAST